MPTASALYVDLLKKSVLEDLYQENEIRLLYLRFCLQGQDEFDPDVLLNIRRRRPTLWQEYLSLREVGINYGRTIQNLGFQHTMIGRRRLENIAFCLEKILAEGIAGDCIECGVWRGGAVIFMRGYLAAYGITDRSVWVADSFAGLPKPELPQDNGLDLTPERYPMLAIDLDTVRDLFQRYGLLDDQVRFLRGWFKETLPSAPIRQLALLRLDGDLYESTWDALVALYDKVSPGGFVVVDDYGVLPQCRQAITDFRQQRDIVDPIQEIDWSGIYWRKT